jgi:hypothetical protein
MVRCGYESGLAMTPGQRLAAVRLVSERDIRDLLDMIESMAESFSYHFDSEIGLQNRGLGGEEAVFWAHDDDQGLDTYRRLRTAYPKGDDA